MYCRLISADTFLWMNFYYLLMCQELPIEVVIKSVLCYLIQRSDKIWRVKVVWGQMFAYMKDV